MDTFERLESEVRSYCRCFPVIFDTAQGCYLTDTDGNRYLDFFSGAGALNYGHNNEQMKARLLEYILRDGITHGLDMATVAKKRFLDKFNDVILKPRNLPYKVQFPGPTGTNAVESALKLARNITGRHNVLSFTNAFHGMTLGSLSVSGNFMKREAAGLVLTHSIRMPYCKYLGKDAETIEYIDRFLRDNGSGVDLPAAIIVETIQAEGGVNVASVEWLQDLEQICRQHELLLILDDIQAGCGRTGPFFSFEKAGIYPDMVCLAKSISGYGLPMALTLIKPELDQWKPGEHNGTFRGNNHAFITATEALNYWETDELSSETQRKGEKILRSLHRLRKQHPESIREIRGRGLMQAIQFTEEDMAQTASQEAFRRGLLIETSGASGSVLKLLPPLTVSDEELDEGLQIIWEATAEILSRKVSLAAH